MMLRSFGGVAAALAVASAGCAAPQSTYAPDPQIGTGAEAHAPLDDTRTRPRADRLTEEEVDAARSTGRAGNAHVLIHQLRPRWLAGDRGTETLHPNHPPLRVQVWYNGRHLGAADEVLAAIGISAIISIRYLDPINARATYGSENGRGAIVITGR